MIYIKKNPQWLISKYLWIQDSWTWTHTEIGRSKVFMFIFSPFFVVDFPYIWIYIYKCVFVYPFIRYWSGLISICFGHLSSLYPLTDTVGCIGMVVYCWLHGANFFFSLFQSAACLFSNGNSPFFSPGGIWRHSNKLPAHSLWEHSSHSCVNLWQINNFYVNILRKKLNKGYS